MARRIRYGERRPQILPAPDRFGAFLDRAAPRVRGLDLYKGVALLAGAPLLLAGVPLVAGQGGGRLVGWILVGASVVVAGLVAYRYHPSNRRL